MRHPIILENEMIQPDQQFIYAAYPEKIPVLLRREGNIWILDCCFQFNRRALRKEPPDAAGRSYAELICEGVSKAWSGTYHFKTAHQPEEIIIRVLIHKAPVRKPVKVCVRPLHLRSAYVISPFYRRIWGFFKTLQIESFGLNWTPEHPGKIVMLPFRPSSVVRRVAAHEMGHILGIGDAYGAFYRFYCEAPGTQDYMMHSNRQVQPEEIDMMFKAHQSGRMQFFPKTWKSSRFFLGLWQAVKRRASRLIDLKNIFKKPQP